jgi:hypothetical protein
MLAGLIADDGAAQSLGAACLAASPSGACDAGALAAAIVAEAPQAFADRESLRAVVAKRVRDDFAAGRVVRADGWIISETEATLCVIAMRARLEA